MASKKVSSKKLSSAVSGMAPAAPEAMSALMTPSHFSFSTVPVASLTSMEYTLATIVVDESGSVAGFKNELERCLKTVLGSCTGTPTKPNPRSDNLLLRAVAFSDDVREVHGFRPVNDIKATEYNGAVHIRGCTALFDAVTSAVEASEVLGNTLVNQDYTANAVIYVITDGSDNKSSTTAKTIRTALNRVAKTEKLASIAVILIMVGTADTVIKGKLDAFVRDAELTQFVDLTALFKDANPEKALGVLAGLISKSVSSTSTSLASGSKGASAAASSKLTF